MRRCPGRYSWLLPLLVGLPLNSAGLVPRASREGSPVVSWWVYPHADCGYDDINATCTGSSLASCKRSCAVLDECGGFNFPHGIMKKRDCMAHKTTSSTGTLYLKEAGPQPNPPPTPPPVPEYDALNVWPMPTAVTLCTDTSFATAGGCLGPHRLSRGSSLKVLYKGECTAEIAPLVAEAVSLGTEFLSPTRTYDEGPYKQADSFCPAARRCSSAQDCHGGECYIPSDRLWNRETNSCAPSDRYQAPCGCCYGYGGQGSLPSITTLAIDCADSSVTAPEGYTLEISANNGVPTNGLLAIAGSTSQGVAYGLATLSQLLRWDGSAIASGPVLDFVPLRISDAPRFSWRGYMLDTSRHFVSTGRILTLLDGMYAAKLNIFHWHVVDSPSFPLASASHPELAKLGSWSGDNRSIYSLEDQAAVIQRAKERFIQVVIEIDTPAHTLAIGKAHPGMMSQCWEWMATSRYKVDVDSDDCMALNPTSPAARQMVSTLLTEAASLTEASGAKFVHIGGDEVKFDCWRSDPVIAAHVNRTYGDLSAASFSRLQAEWTANVSAAAVVRAGKRPVLWQPTTKGPGDPAWDGVLPASAIYMVWLNSESAQKYAANGSDVVFTTPFYVAGMGAGGWNQVYNAQIIPNDLTPAQQKHILGAEICMWGESLSAGNLAERAFQIGAAAAESFWRNHSHSAGPASAAGLGTSDRYNRFLCHLLRYGIEAAPIMPSFCSKV